MKRDPQTVGCTLAGHKLQAVSVAGVETCIQLPDLDLCFDIGRCPISAVHRRTVLITHGHVDHLGGIIHHVSLRALWGLSPSRIVVPRVILPDVTALLEVWRKLAHQELPVDLVGLSPGEPFELSPTLTVTGVPASHRVPTFAYLLHRTRESLRGDLVGLQGHELAARRAAGEVVNERIPVLEVAFTGDTRAALLDREPRMGTARLLICECTFFANGPADDQSRARADRTGHLCLDDLRERASSLRNEVILLTHASARHGRRQIGESLARLPPGLRERVKALRLITPE